MKKFIRKFGESKKRSTPTNRRSRTKRLNEQHGLVDDILFYYPEAFDSSQHYHDWIFQISRTFNVELMGMESTQQGIEMKIRGSQENIDELNDLMDHDSLREHPDFEYLFPSGPYS
jgi:hypothetical protein